MLEYVCRYVVRDSDRPLDERVLFEHGTPATDAWAFVAAVGAFAELMKLHGTPEAAVVALMKHKILLGS